MRIIINGENEEIQEGITLLELISGRGLDPRTVVAELNRNIIAGEDFAAVRLNPDDSLELLHFVGGG
ncbi:sulfur carrier protein ThiS [uncultured Mailhella sp.]|uniref:sulfur carrier protein ThiS n=1 Tax=uncultured Mailhella sp. TaxID=1981031 RepID=UPI00262392D5|nr:sulfur carrier protein ThiS [uncultured Mailhella sp.]